MKRRCIFEYRTFPGNVRSSSVSKVGTGFRRAWSSQKFFRCTLMIVFAVVIRFANEG
jgi:hypothetical protein